MLKYIRVVFKAGFYLIFTYPKLVYYSRKMDKIPKTPACYAKFLWALRRRGLLSGTGPLRWQFESAPTSQITGAPENCKN